MNRTKCSFLTAMLVFGTVGIFVRQIPLPSATIAFFRGALGVVTLLLIMALTKKKPNVSEIKQNLFLLLLSGVAIGGNWILLFEAYRHTTVATATICYYLAPVFLVLASPLLGERLTTRKLLLSATALLGMVFVSGVLQGGITGIRGITCGIGAAALYGSVMFMNKKLHPINAYDKTVIQLAAAALVILPYSLISHGFDFSGMDTKGYLVLAIVGIVHTGICYCMYFGAMGNLSSQSVALFSYLDPVMAIILSALLLKEAFGWQETMGAVLILGSALLSELGAQKNAKKG